MRIEATSIKDASLRRVIHCPRCCHGECDSSKHKEQLARQLHRVHNSELLEFGDDSTILVHHKCRSLARLCLFGEEMEYRPRDSLRVPDKLRQAHSAIQWREETVGEEKWNKRKRNNIEIQNSFFQNNSLETKKKEKQELREKHTLKATHEERHELSTEVALAVLLSVLFDQSWERMSKREWKVMRMREKE